MTGTTSLHPVPDRPLGLAALALAERDHDGPFPPDLALDPAERHASLVAEALTARRFFAERVRRALRFARAHRAQARPDLMRLILQDAQAYRADFRRWHRRVLLLGSNPPD